MHSISNKYRKTTKLIIYITFFSFMFMVNSCYNTKIQNVYEDSIPKIKGEYIIINIYTKSGQQIKLSEEMNAKFLPKYKDNENVILYNSITKIKVGEDTTKQVVTTNIIPVKEVTNIKIERSEFNVVGTVLLTAGIAALILLIIFIIGFKSIKFVPERI